MPVKMDTENRYENSLCCSIVVRYTYTLEHMHTNAHMCTYVYKYTYVHAYKYTFTVIYAVLLV